MALKFKDYSRIAVNSVTDPGVLFNAGNVVVSSQHSWEAAAVNGSVALLSGATRAVSEIKASGINFSPTNRLLQNFDTFAENKGAGLVTSGALTLTSSAITLAQSGFDDPQAMGAAGMLACFGLVHTFRGVASGMRDGLKKYALDSAGFAMAVGGYLFANPDLPLALKISYGAIACLSVYMTLMRENPSSFKQPDLYFATTSYGAALATDEINVAFGFASWATAYLSIDAMNKKGGVWQRVGGFFRNNNEQPPTGPFSNRSL